MDRTQSAFIEARDFFRIDDKLELSYRLATSNELEAPNYAFDVLEMDQHTDLLTALEILNKDAHELLNKIAENNSAIANYLKILDHKLLLLTKTLIYKADIKKTNLHLVNISEAGISFGTNEALQINDLLRIRFILPPMLQEIAIYGKVTRVEPKAQAKKFDPNYSYWIAMCFTHIQSSDRQLLARYILQKQTLKYKDQ